MARKTLDRKVKQAVLQYIQALKDDHLPLKEVFVFGSRAKGTAHRDSDIDVAVISPQLKSAAWSTKYLLKKAHALRDTQFTIEPHAFHPSTFVDENPLVWEIKKDGIPL